MKNIIIIFIFALSTSIYSKNWVFDIGPGLSKGNISHSSFDSSIDIIQYSLSGSVAYRIWKVVFFGAETRYEWVRQLTDIEEAGSNISGRMWSPISPIIVLPLSVFALKISYQFFGDYKLSNNNFDGDSVTWKKAHGIKLSLLMMKVFSKHNIEFLYQNRSFKEQLIGEAKEPSRFIDRPKITSYGVEYKIIF